MKVLYVGSDALVCGASFSMAKLIEEEEKLGIDVIPVVHVGNTEKILKNTRKDYYLVNAWSWIVNKDMSNIKKMFYRVVKSMLNIPCYFKYLKIIKNENPDIIHINALTTYVIAKAAVKMKKPIVWHIRELIEEDLNCCFWSKKTAYKLMKKATYFIAISKSVEDKYKSVVGEEKIRCIYNGIDQEIFYDDDHEILKDSKIIITMAGRITKEKGQLFCLKALIPVLKENSNIILQFAGTGNQNEIVELMQARADAGLTDAQVKLLGHVKNMNRLWSETDIAIVYSKFEAFGRVTIEAKMAGALVVGYNSGGTSELIENNIDGYLFDEEKTKLINVIRKIIVEKENSRKIAKNGRETASKIFTSKNNAIQVYKLYQEILSKNR